MLSVYMARELGGRGITVNTIAPVLSPPILAVGWCGRRRGKRAVCRHDGAGTGGRSRDIGPMIASLLRDDNRWVTAQRIEVSGGQTIWTTQAGRMRSSAACQPHGLQKTRQTIPFRAFADRPSINVSI